jgi:putative redox protein
MDMINDFPGGSRVDAHFRGHTVATDQPPVDSAPMPFEIFLASIGTCAGIYVLGFCKQRNHAASNGMVQKIDLEIQVPPTFPAQYYDALIRSAELCKVKKTLENPPSFEVTTVTVEVA